MGAIAFGFLFVVGAVAALFVLPIIIQVCGTIFVLVLAHFAGKSAESRVRSGPASPSASQMEATLQLAGHEMRVARKKGRLSFVRPLIFIFAVCCSVGAYLVVVNLDHIPASELPSEPQQTDVPYVPESVPEIVPPISAAYLPDLDREDVASGFKEFERVFRAEGLRGIASGVRRCREEAAANPSWSALDRCAALGYAAADFAAGLTAVGGGSAANYISRNDAPQVSYYVSRGIADEQIEDRLQHIRAMVSEYRERTTITLAEVSEALAGANSAAGTSKAAPGIVSDPNENSSSTTPP